jgi:RNA-binding protein YhbY
MSESTLGDALKTRLLADAGQLEFAFKITDGVLTPEFYARLAKTFQERDLVKVRLLATARPARAGHIAHLVKHGQCTYVGMIGKDAVLFRPKGRDLPGK